MKAIVLGFVFLLLLGLASINGNSALFDSVPFGGWSFLVLYLTFHFSYLASVSARNKMPSSTARGLGWGVFAYLAIIVGALPVSIYLAGEKKFGWISMLLSVLGLLIAYRVVQNGGTITLAIPSVMYRREKWVRVAWTTVFGLLVLRAKSFDLLNHNFPTAGVKLLTFNLARLFLVIYLGFGLFQIGIWILKLADISSSQTSGLRGLDRVILCTVLGGATGTIGMFLLGVVNLYYPWLIFILVLPIVWVSGRWLVPGSEWILFALKRFFRHKTFHQAYLPSLLLAALIVGLCLTFVVKGLWPGDAGGDVYSHYLPYYREVIARHGLSPNALWYHYYVSKGAGLFFLGMLLSDELAPQLVTLCFHFIFAAIIYDLVKRMTRVRIAGLFAVVLLFYLYLPLRIWGIFLKHHEMMGCWLFFGVWLSIFVGRQKILRWRQCVVGGVIFAVAFALQFPTAVGLIAPLWGLTGLWYFATARLPAGLYTWLLSATSIGSLSCLVAFNQWQTGLGLDTPIRLFWKFADVKHFAQWVSPYLMIYLDEGSSKGVGEIASPFAKLGDLPEFARLLRWENLPSIPIHYLAILALVLVAAFAIAKRRKIGQSEIASQPFLLIVIAWLIPLLAERPPSDRQLLLFSAALLSFAVAFYFSALSRYLRRLFEGPVFTEIASLPLLLIVIAWSISLLAERPPSDKQLLLFLAALLALAVAFYFSALSRYLRRLFERQVFTDSASLALLLIVIAWLISLLAERPPSDKQLLLFLAALLAFGVAFYFSALSRYLRRLFERQVFSDSALFLICLTALAWFMGKLVNQPVSVYRMFAFLSGVSITGGVVFWTLCLGVVRQGILPSAHSKRGLTAVFLTFAMCLCCSTMLAGVRERIRPMIGFALGLESAKVALASVPEEYSTHGNVWPPYLAARKLVGLKAPILTFGINGDLLGTSFAFPGPGLQSEVSYSLGPHWHIIAFGSPEMGERELRNLGINYFLVDWRYESLFGGVPMSNLFAPEQFGKRFSILADYGGVWLLTWRNGEEHGIAADKIMIWDLVRNGCVDPGATPQIVKDFADRLGRLLADKSFTPPAIRCEDQALVAISDRMEAELRDVLPHDLLDTTFEAVTANTKEAFLQALSNLHFLDQAGAIVDRSDASPNDSMFLLAKAILHQVSGNIKRQILLQLKPATDQETARTFIDMNNQALVTRRAKDLYDVVHETFDFNHGATNSVVRKPGLRRVEGWQ
jgi:hypothetical protein